MHNVSNATLRLAMWNIRAGGLGTEVPRNALQVIDGIGALDADVVMPQEADPRLGFQWRRNLRPSGCEKSVTCDELSRFRLLMAGFGSASGSAVGTGLVVRRPSGSALAIGRALEAVAAL